VSKTISIDELIADPNNARKHSAENIKAIEKSLKQFGAARSLFVDKDGVVRAGNGTLEAAKKAGFKDVKIVDTDANTLVAVRRKDLDATEAMSYAIADNKSAELAEWDETVLAEAIEQLVNNSDLESIEAMGFSETELKKIIEHTNVPDDVGREYDESIADDIEMCKCPKCEFEFPK